jgi:hypothetical protein
MQGPSRQDADSQQDRKDAQEARKMERRTIRAVAKAEGYRLSRGGSVRGFNHGWAGGLRILNTTNLLNVE